ncbi:MAG: homoserine dehydrogenase [Synergistaceae bacterium]|nr:homoserine dehydrogenase [Synergistaceae bacterium]
MSFRSNKFRLGIVGYGNLGRATVNLLLQKSEHWRTSDGIDLALTCVLDVNGGFYNADGLNCEALAAHGRASLDSFNGFDAKFNFKEMIDERLVDIIAEYTPTNKETGEPGLSHIRYALQNGIHVTTSNKGPILVAWPELSLLARNKGLMLGVGCTTGGALPSVIAGRDAMAGADTSIIEGVLNGTTNYILSRMESGLDYIEALKEAQAAGIAETDPGMDVDGWDSAVKLVILAKVVMNGNIDLKDVPVKGISGLSIKEMETELKAGRRIKLIGRAWREGGVVRASVAPESVDKTHPFYSVSAKDKCVRYVSDTLGDLFVSGGASGPIPAAASAMRDVLLAWRTGIIV